MKVVNSLQKNQLFAGIEEVFCDIAKQLLQSRKNTIQPEPVPHGLPQRTPTGEEGEEISDSCCT